MLQSVQCYLYKLDRHATLWAGIQIVHFSITLIADFPCHRAVQFWYEWHDEAGQWYRTYGLEDWTFADNGLMRKRQMSGNDVKISDEERWYKDGVDVNTVDISEKHW